MKRTCIINGKLFKSYDNQYFVSQCGEVYSTYCGKVLKPSLDHDGYLRVDIHGRHFKVHKLVYLTWVGEIPDGMQINHKDDNKLNNDYRNLYCGTQKQNISDCLVNGHRVGNMFYLTIKDKQLGKLITFCPATDFIDYSGHTCTNGGVSRMFKTNWFKKRYEVIEFKKVDNLKMFLELKGVTTMGDECNPVE